MSIRGRMAALCALGLGIIMVSGCGDKARGLNMDGASPDSGQADSASTGGDLAGSADLGVKGPLALKLEQEDISESGYQGTYTILEVTAGKQLICTNKFYCKKTCAIPLADADYLGLLNKVQASGFMKADIKSQHCVDDMGYDRLTAWISADGGSQKAVYEGQTLFCPNIDGAARAVYQALGELALKVVPKSGCI